MGSRIETGLSTPTREMIEGFGHETIARLIEGLAASKIPMAIFDPDDRLVYFCPSFASIYAVPDGPQTFSSLIRNCHATHRGPLIDTDDIEEWLEGADTRRRSKPNRRFEIDLVDGRWFQALETTYDDGWVLLVLIDLTAFKAKEARLTTARDAAMREAQTDDLTGLASRRAIMRYLDAATRAANANSPLSIALMDVDHFKQINDTLGHDAGDEVLSLLGRHLASAFRNTDRAGRVGGEEFLLVLPGASAASTWLGIERLRRLWSEASRTHASTLGSSFSIGIAQWEEGQSAGELYRRADQALYLAKAAGRNRTICAGDVFSDPNEAKIDPLAPTGS